MDDEILHSCWTKATTAESDEVRYSGSWIFARRAKLYVTRHELRCGDWRIPYEDIRNAVLFSVRSALLLPGYVLKVDVGATTYQFGLNGWGEFWKGDLPFAVRRERARLGHSTVGLTIRALAFGYVLYWVWRRFG